MASGKNPKKNQNLFSENRPFYLKGVENLGQILKFTQKGRRHAQSSLNRVNMIDAGSVRAPSTFWRHKPPFVPFTWLRTSDKFWKFVIPEVAVGWRKEKNPPEMCTSRENGGEIRPSLTSLSKWDSAQYLWQLQSLFISSEWICQIPPVGRDTAYMGMSCDSIGRQKEGRKKNTARENG